MENKIEEKLNFSQKTKNLIIKYQAYFLSALSFIIIAAVGFTYFNYLQSNENEKIAENYIKAGMYLTNNDKEKAKDIYKEIINKKNKIYSILSLNNIIDNNLEINQNEILKLFSNVESLKVKKNQKDLIKLKKALYLIKSSKKTEGKKLLNELKSQDSVWKNLAQEINDDSTGLK